MKDGIDRHEADAARDRSPGVTTSIMTDEVEGYRSSVAGMDIEAVRAGPSRHPTRVTAATNRRFTFTHSSIGFAMLSRSTVPDGMIALAYVRSAPIGSRWCEIDLEPAKVIVEGPACEHTARNLPGLDFMFVLVSLEQVKEHAEQLGFDIAWPRRGEAQLLADRVNSSLARPALSKFADAAATGVSPTGAVADDVMRSAAYALSGGDPDQRVGVTKRIDSRHVVHACIEYAASIQRIPSISELCLVAHVSERRMREAFTEEYDIPPSRFFRLWALDEAHRRLARSEGDTVTDIAMGLGFDHLGRFAGHYKGVYSEAPSTTMRRRDRRTASEVRNAIGGFRPR